MAMRRGDLSAQPMPEPADAFYQARLSLYDEVISGTEKLALASLWALHQAERSEAIELALRLAPDINWGTLAGHVDDVCSGNVISLAAAGALKHFFALSPDAKGDELSALLADAKKHGVRSIGAASRTMILPVSSMSWQMPYRMSCV